jgi:predicted transcriptional regulator
MATNTISFRIDTKQKKALDIIAKSLDRDRSYIINQAIRAYLELYSWQTKKIKEGIRQVSKGDCATNQEVKAAVKRLKK